MGHRKVTIGHPRLTIRHLRVTIIIGHLKATVVYIRKGNYRLFFSISNIRQSQLSFTPK